MNFLQKILSLIFIIIFIKILSYVVNNFNIRYTKENNLNKLTYGLASRKDLVSIPNSNFIKWCASILESVGIYNIEIITNNLNDNYQAQGYINEKLSYIKFVKLEKKNLKNNPNDDEDEFWTVGRPDLQKLVGTMEQDNVKVGYIITNGNFTNEAIEYAQSMPPNYYLKIIDGCELTRMHRMNQNQYLSGNLD